MRYPKWLVSLSIKANETVGGKQGYTICAALWERGLLGKRGGHTMVCLTDLLFYPLEDNHCYRSWRRRQKDSL